MAGRRWYRLLLLAFPRRLRRRHGDDMVQLFADRCREARVSSSAVGGGLRVSGLWLLAIRDAVLHGLLARIASRSGALVGLNDTGMRRESLARVVGYELSHAARGLRTSIGFTAVALTSLALGIGASTAIFTLVNALMLRPLPVTEPERLVLVGTSAGFSGDRYTNPLWESLRDRERLFDGVFAVGDGYLRVRRDDDFDRIRTAWIGGAFFPTLGLDPAAGRLIEPGDDRRGCPAVAVLGHGYWQRRYGGADVIGETISLDDQPFEIVGVAEAGFDGMTVEVVTEIYLPICAEAIVRGDRSVLDARRTWWLSVVGRLPEDAEFDQVDAQLQALAPAVLRAAVPTTWGEERQAEFMQGGLELRPGATGFSAVRSQYRYSLFVLLAAVGVVMLVVCTNLANLLMARAVQRRRELAVRIALGASGRRLLVQSLTESLLLAGLGAAAGLVLAHWTSRALVLLITPPAATLSIDLSMDLRVLGFTTLVATATGVLFGLGPAVHALRVHPHAAMKGSGPGPQGAPSLFGGGTLVAAQVTLSLVLLTAAALLIGTFWHLETLDPGFDRDRVVLVEADISRAGYEPEANRETFLATLERLRAIPGVRAASLAELTPISGNSVTEFIVAVGFESLLDEDAEVYVHRVGAGYFASLGSPVLRGRDFTDDDAPGSEPVAMISESTARLVFGGLDAVGRSFHRRLNDIEVGESIRVIGVVRDAKYRSLRDDDTPTVYFARRQQPVYHWGSSMTFQVLPAADGAGLATAIRTVVEASAAGARVEVGMLSNQLSASLARERLLAIISGFFGVLALFLAVLGLYGVMAFNVSRRLHEIGVRLALGATQRGVFAQVLRQATRPVAVGLAVGGAASFFAVRTIGSLLYGMNPNDGRAFGLAVVVLATAAIASAAIPARRAARLDPAVVLRQDVT